MACSVSSEEENYFKIAKIVLNVIPANLREKFKIRWKDEYSSDWTDDRNSGSHFSAELSKKREVYTYPSIKDKIEAGDTKEWDCTTLFFAFRTLNLYGSDAVKSSIEKNLRSIRNEIAHTPKNELSKADYDRILCELKKTFGALYWVDGLEEIRLIDESELENDHFRELEQQLITERKHMENISGIIDDHEQRISALESKYT